MSSSRNITWLPKTELSIHDAVRQTPEDRSLVELLFNEFTAKLAAGADPQSLIRDALEITSAKEIEDGRHRFLAAMRVPAMKLLPCIVDDDCDPETLVIEKLTQRRHYSKSAKAYALRLMALRIAEANKATRAGNVIGGRDKDGSFRKPIESAFGRKGSETLAQLALKTGLSEDILQQAVKLERDYMRRADQLIADWLNLNPEDAESWQTWQDVNPTLEMPWSCWRSQALAAAGLPDDPKSVNVIPKNWRELEEDKIFNGIVEPDGDSPDDRRSYSLGSALKALGSIFATAGKPRPDVNPENPALYLTLRSKLKSFSASMWKQWSEVDQVGRLEVIKDLADAVITWPDDVRAALSAKLNVKGGAR